MRLPFGLRIKLVIARRIEGDLVCDLELGRLLPKSMQDGDIVDCKHNIRVLLSRKSPT